LYLFIKVKGQEPKKCDEVVMTEIALLLVAFTSSSNLKEDTCLVHLLASVAWHSRHRQMIHSFFRAIHETNNGAYKFALQLAVAIFTWWLL